MSQKSVTYDACDLHVFEGLEAVRKRPGMYVGSTDERGLHRLVLEAAAWALEEVVLGRSSRAEMTLMRDGGVRVAIDGPGVAFEGGGDADDPGLDVRLTRLAIGRRPSGPLNPRLSSFSLGLAVVNALSSRLVAEAQCEGVRRVREYTHGVVVTPHADPTQTRGTGTTITFWPDADVFTTTECSFDVLADRFQELAFLNRGLDVALSDERDPSDPRSVRFRSPGGVREMVDFLDGQTTEFIHADVIGFEREDARMAGTMEVALRWRESGQQRVRSYADSDLMRDGGTHLLGFFDGVGAAIDAYARERQLTTVPDPDRIREGLTAVVSVKLASPEFEGATRSMLGNVAVRACVREAILQHLGTWLAEHPQEAATLVARFA